MPAVAPPTSRFSVLAVHGSAALLAAVDPRSRVLAAAAFSVLVAVANRLPVLGLALAVGVVATVAAGADLGQVARRMLGLNALLLVMLIFVPLTLDGPPAFSLGPLHLSRPGLRLAAQMALKSNAIVLGLLALVGPIDLTTLGHTLRHLYVPEKLAHLLLFTVRYLEVLDREYGRLTAAMRLRGFRPRMNWHTYRSYGYLVGMLLVRSLARSERIVAAMKCRGFRGRFYLLDHFAFSRHDAWFGVACLSILTLLAGLEWLPH